MTLCSQAQFVHRPAVLPAPQVLHSSHSIPLRPTRLTSLVCGATTTAPAAAASTSSSSSSSSSSLAIQEVSYQDGTFSIVGKLTCPVPPDQVYAVLTDYAALSRVFHNIEDCQVRISENGAKQLIQRCSWRFLIFKGSFVTELQVTELPSTRQLSFALQESAFMKAFVGAWDVRETADQAGSEILHRLAVAPTVAPPQKLGDLTKRIFVSQVEGILADLENELLQRSSSDSSSSSSCDGSEDLD